MNSEHPPEAWDPARRAAQRLMKPLESFLHVEAASATVLLLMALAALALANSALSEAFHHLWETPITLGFGEMTTSQSLHFWVNDGLMVFFFFVVGLEIRREIHEGELSTLKRAALPIVAALGGMLIPAAVYLALNVGTASVQGWGVPMATDIAFAVGILALLGKRVPAALRVLLLALAIIDDIGAILVIALFYSSGISLVGIGIAAGGVVAILLMQRVGIRSPLLYVVPGVVVWIGALLAGVHPTIAGVIIGLLTPVRRWYGPAGFVQETRRVADEVERLNRDEALDEHAVQKSLGQADEARRETLSPVVRLQLALHPWVAYLIMPVFALANAGVSLGGVDLGDAELTPLILGVGAGLVLGKPLGVLAVSWVAVRLGLCELPRGVSWTGILVVGLVAGIGFTMAIFISGLAFTDPAQLDAAKLSVLMASGLAAVAALVIGRLVLPAQTAPDAARTADEAEHSTAT